ncbi:MAG TPA: hypothetical protein V6C81_14565 [Planktothrix sp.]|jgi:hypothetical protein
MSKVPVIFLAALATSFAAARFAYAADDLKLRAGVSFTQDIDAGFPIVASNMDDCALPPGKPAFLFFGASGDLNTNREAKRVVDLYKKVSSKQIKFILLDVDHPPNDDARKLIKTYYKGYIPEQVVIDKTGKVLFNQIGEVEMGVLKSQIDKVVD